MATLKKLLSAKLWEISCYFVGESMFFVPIWPIALTKTGLSCYVSRKVDVLTGQMHFVCVVNLKAPWFSYLFSHGVVK